MRAVAHMLSAIVLGSLAAMPARAQDTGNPAMHIVTYIEAAPASAKENAALLTSPIRGDAVGGAAVASNWLGQYFAAGGGAYCDGIAFHGYGNSRPSVAEEVGAGGLADYLTTCPLRLGASPWNTASMLFPFGSSTKAA